MKNNLQHYETIIIGGGVMGASTAYYLSQEKRGKILLVDQLPFKNTLNSSADYSRVFRVEYGDDTFYTNLALESLVLWKELEKIINKQLYFPCGALLLGENNQDHAMLSYTNLKKLGHGVSFFEKKDLEKKFPQFCANYAVLDKSGGILDAFAAVEAFIILAKQNGVSFKQGKKVISIKNKIAVFEDGSKISFDKAVVTAGIWTQKIIERELPISITKQQIIYLRPKNKSLFYKNVFPPFAYIDKGFYGLPMHGIDAVKITTHKPGEKVINNFFKYKVKKSFIKECYAFCKEYVPALADAKIVDKKVRFYDMTPDGDFIIDNLDSNTVIGAGFSGHAFKFAPLIGKILADIVQDKPPRYDISRFQLSRF